MIFADLAGANLFSGTCQRCGCTDESACPGGCIWANAEATLCSRCARENGDLDAVAYSLHVPPEDWTAELSPFVNDHEDDGPEDYREFWENEDA